LSLTNNTESTQSIFSYTQRETSLRSIMRNIPQYSLLFADALRFNIELAKTLIVLRACLAMNFPCKLIDEL